MATPTKLLRTTARWWRCRTAVSSKTLRKPSFAAAAAAAAAGPQDSVINSTPSEVQILKQIPEDSRTRYLFSSLFAGLVGVTTLETACADADQNVGSYTVPPVPSESSSGGVDLDDLAKKERSRIEELLKHKGMHNGSYPKFTVAVKGQKVTIKFQVPTACDISQLIASLVHNLGVKAEERGGGADMLLRGWDSPGTWQLTLNYPDRQKEVKGEPNVEENIVQGDLCVLIFRSHINSERAEIEFIKPRSLTAKELEAFVSILSLAGEKLGHGRFMEKSPRDGNAAKASPAKAISSLESMGVIVYGLREPPASAPSDDISWDNIAGYDKQKREIEDTILMALHNPQVYDEIARGTRCKFESNRPRAVLFEGPPGTGKTSCARVIASQSGVPLLYVPLEVVMSKYYGESERLLGQVFQLANQLQDGAIIFLDEVDSFAVARDNEMHEATRRILSVLLRQIDGFEQDKKVVVIAATNRKQDLDPALISRFDSIIEFELPDQQNRKEIAAQYAKHLTDEQLVEFAALTEGMSGRDIRDVCQQAERMWASKIIRGGGRRQVKKEEEKKVLLPPLQEYMDSAANRKQSLQNIETEKKKKKKMSPPLQPLSRYLD